jgi:DNA-binding CsgD family transcriptional regulator
VRTHVKSLLRKLGVNSQLAAVALARGNGWDELDFSE